MQRLRGQNQPQAAAAAAMLPPGWPFPGKDMSQAQFDADGHNMNDLSSAASPFGPLAPVSEQQIDLATNPPSVYNQLLGDSDPETSPARSGRSHSSGSKVFTSPAPAYKLGLLPPPTFQPQTISEFHYPPGAIMQYFPQSPGPMFNMAQPAQNNFFPQQNMPSQNSYVPQQTNFISRQGVVAQNSFVPQAQNMVPQNNFVSHQNMMTQSQSMVPQNHMMATMMGPSPSPGPTPVPVQYQNNFNTQAGPMVPYQNFMMEAQQPQQPEKPPVTITEPWAMKYHFHAQGTPPFVDLTRDVAPSEKPIIVIKNIPYTITHNEIQQFLSKSLLPHSLGHLTNPGPSSLPIHVVMERGTGKTQDCFIELPSHDIARICIERVENLVMAGKPPKMAQRIVVVEISCQGELMKEIFPRAKNMLWDMKTGIPVMLKSVDSFCSGFRGFLTCEELNNVVRYAETPQRSPFAIRCQQRTYEMMMSTLAKFPWASVYYTLEHRDQIFRAYLNQLSALLPKVFVEEYGGTRNQRVVGLDARLVASYVEAGLHCPGFNEGQKSDILDITNQNYTYRGVSEFAPAWPFEALTKPAGVGDQDLGMWLRLLVVGAQSAMAQKISLTIGKAGREFVSVKLEKNGNVIVIVSEQGRTKVGFSDLARMELKLMRCMLMHGWEQVYGNNLLSLYIEDDEDQLSNIEKKMMALGVFQLGMDRPGARIDSNSRGTPQSAASKDKVVVARDERATPTPGEEQGQEIHFEDPFHGRAKSVASDSGFSGMHRGMEMKQLLKGAGDLAQQAQVGQSPFKTPGSSERGRRSYADALGSILVNTEMANAPGRIRAGGSVVSIKSPDGQELNFSKKILTTASSNSRYNSPERDARTLDPFTTPRRRSDSSTGSSGNVSPRTKTNSPKKSYTIKSSPGPVQVLGPIGTPSRRSLQDNTITIGATISEEAEDESIMMRGGRSRDHSRSFY